MSTSGGGGRRPAMLALPTTPQRLHPLSPVVRAGRSFIAVVVLLVLSTAQSSPDRQRLDIDLAILGFAAVMSGVTWAVTTWSVDGQTLQVATGLIRRQTVQVPLARIQAVDLVEPWLARVLGMAEVRVRTGGGGSGDARLMYLRLADAQLARSSLLALAHGLPGATPEAPERFLVRANNGRLIAGIALTGSTLLGVLSVTWLVAFGAIGQKGAASTALVVIFSVVSGVGRRIGNEWNFTVAEAPDGLRIRCGIGSRISETIPTGRVQAVRMVEPLFWRPLGWYRLELHLAGGVSRRRRQTRAVVLRALLPVGLREETEMLLGRLLVHPIINIARPPRAAMLRAPFSYHFLGAGHDDWTVISTSGRLRKRTEWIPLSKVQSVRYVQGPLARALGLATVHLDAAGRGAQVRYEYRGADEARGLVGELTLACAKARKAERLGALARQAPPGVQGPPPAVPPPPFTSTGLLSPPPPPYGPPPTPPPPAPPSPFGPPRGADPAR